MLGQTIDKRYVAAFASKSLTTLEQAKRAAILRHLCVLLAVLRMEQPGAEPLVYFGADEVQLFLQSITLQRAGCGSDTVWAQSSRIPSF